jgi:iron complex outermembrane receptor protein
MNWGLPDLIRRRWLDNDFYVLNASVDYNSKNLNLNFSSFYSSYSGDHYGEIIWARTFSQNGKIRDRYYEGNGNKKDFSLFSKASFNFGKKTELYTDFQFRKVSYKTTGLTSDLVSMLLDKKYNFFNPKFGISYKFKPNSMLYFSFARANREPSRSDYEANLRVKPEELNDLELGWRLRNEKIKLNINSYYMFYSNQLVLTGELDDVGSPIRTNSGKSYRLGIEIDNFIELSDLITLQSNLTISSNKNKEIISKVDGKIYNYGKTNISFSPDLIASNIIKYSPNNFIDVSLLSKYVGEQYMSNNDSKNSLLESYFINDLNLTYDIRSNKLFDSITLSALINNLFNIEYISNGYYYTYDDTWSNPDEVVTLDGAGYYPQATRNFLFGVLLKF